METISGDGPGLSWDEHKLKHFSPETLWPLQRMWPEEAWWLGAGGRHFKSAINFILSL